MQDQFENLQDDLPDTDNEFPRQICDDCPYLTRRMPFQPFPPQQQPSGAFNRPPSGSPPGPPPNRVPFKPQFETQAVSPGSLRPCTYRFVYIWLNNGRSFWAWLTRVDRISASGFRWQGRRWVYFGVDLRRIDYFQCY